MGSKGLDIKLCHPCLYQSISQSNMCMVGHIYRSVIISNNKDSMPRKTKWAQVTRYHVWCWITALLPQKSTQLHSTIVLDHYCGQTHKHTVQQAHEVHRRRIVRRPSRCIGENECTPALFWLADTTWLFTVVGQIHSKELPVCHSIYQQNRKVHKY